MMSAIATTALSLMHDDLPPARPLIPGPCIFASAVAFKRTGGKLDAILDNDSQVVVYIEQPDPSDSIEAFKRYGERCAAVLNAINAVAGQ